MAFDQDNFAPVGPQSSTSPRVYTYNTTDTLAEVESDGYFADKQYQLIPGDWILVNTQLTNVPIQVTPDTSTAVTPQFFGQRRVYVRKPEDISNPLPGVQYWIDGVVDMGAVSINVPSTGLTLSGYGFGVSGLTSSEPGYTLFIGPSAGNLFISGLELEVSGAGSAVFGITDINGTHAIEMSEVNFNGCASLGYISGYRQILEDNTGRFGGSPELEYRGSMDGVRVSTSIVRGVTVPSALYKAGAGLTFSGRFVINQNVRLPATGAWIDFSPANFTNDESFVVNTCFVTRLGVPDAADATIVPNITQDSVKSNWGGNTGIRNTQKYLRSYVSAEVATVVAMVDTYYPLAGTFTLESGVHFDMPANGEFRALTGTGNYIIAGDISISGTANDVVDVRVTKSTDGGATWPTQVNHIRRVINNLAGMRDIGFYSLSFGVELSDGDRLRIEVKNTTAANNVTGEVDSYLMIASV